MGLKRIGKENLEHKLLMSAIGCLVATWHDDVIMSYTPNQGDVINDVPYDVTCWALPTTSMRI